MPRDIIQIRGFDKGILSSQVDPEDLAEGAAAWSVDVDPNVHGFLAGRRDDVPLVIEDTGQFVGLIGGELYSGIDGAFPEGPPADVTYIKNDGKNTNYCAEITAADTWSTNGVRFSLLTQINSGTTIIINFIAKRVSGPSSLRFMLNSTDSVDVPITDTWEEYSVPLTLTANSTAIGIYSTSQSLTSVVRIEYISIFQSPSSVDFVESAFLLDKSPHLVGYDKTRGEVVAIHNFYGPRAPSYRRLGFVSASDKPTFVTQNKAIHAGMGPDPDTPPKWVGFVEHSQVMRSAPPRGIFIEDAECKNLSPVPFFHKIIDAEEAGVKKVVGAAYNGSTLFKINLESDTVELESAQGDFQKIIALCDEDDISLWVLDDIGPFGVLKKVRKSDLTIEYSRALGEYILSTAAGTKITDMCATNNNIFFAAHVMEPTQNYTLWGTQWVWRVDKPDGSGGELPVVNVTPQLASTSVISGGWVRISQELGQLPTFQYIRETFPLSLIQTSGDSVGWLVRVGWPFYWDPYIQTGGPYLRLADGSAIGCSLVIVNILESDEFAAPFKPVRLLNNDIDSYNGTGLAIVAVRTFALSRVSGTASQIQITNQAPSFPTSAGSYSNALITPVQPAFLPNDQPFIWRLSGQSKSTSKVYTHTTNTEPKIGRVAFSTIWYHETLFEGNPLSISVTASTTGNSFPDNRTYFYRASVVYDGFQESPLSITAPFINKALGDKRDHTLNITINNASRLSLRVSHINIYRSEGKYGATQAAELYRRVFSIGFDSPILGYDTNLDRITFSLVDDFSIFGATYESHTGISETITRNIVYYSLATEVNNMLFVARCYLPGIHDAMRMIFRSQVGRYDMFNWIENFLVLPTIPTAMAGYNGKLFVFDEDTVYIVNPEYLLIENRFRVGGAHGSKAIAVLPEGVYHADRNGVYLTTTNETINLSKVAIHKSDIGNGWEGVDFSKDIYLTYSEENQSVIVVTTLLSGVVQMFVFSRAKQAWYVWTSPLTNPSSAFRGLRGDAYLVGGSLYRLGAGSNLKQFTWYSQLIAPLTSQEKRALKIRLSKEGGITTSFKINNTGSFTTLAGDTVPQALRGYKQIQLRCISEAPFNTAIVRSIDFITRIKEGVR